MAKRNVNSDNRLAGLLIELKRHFRTCKGCSAAIKARDRESLCDHTVGLILTAAFTYDRVIPRRIAAKRNNMNVFYSCPDLSAHGKAYALTAEALIATGVQESLP